MTRFVKRGLSSRAALVAGAVVFALSGAAVAAEKAAPAKGTLTQQFLEDVKAGTIDVEADHAAVMELVVKKNIPITYDYVASLMRTPNAFGAGPACIVCHNSNDPTVSYRGLDLSTCEGIKTGATEAPVRKTIVAGEGKKGLIRDMLRNNRMPLGVSFATPTDSDNIKAVYTWIKNGAKDDKEGAKIVELLKTPNAFGTEQTCVDCHMSNEEPPSFHELDLTTVKGIHLGADAIAFPAIGKPPTKIVKAGDPEGSKLYQRLVFNRMPPGIDPSEDREHPNMELLVQWIDQGAKCN